MGNSDILEQRATRSVDGKPVQQRRVLNAVWQPFLQFKLLMYLLGSTALAAILLAVFLYFTFSDLISTLTSTTESQSYYGQMIELQLVQLFTYCGALFVLYVALLASVCVIYTHRLTGPLRPFVRHVEKLTAGDYSSRVTLRKTDLEVYNDYAKKLNELALKLNAADTAADTTSKTSEAAVSNAETKSAADAGANASDAMTETASDAGTDASETKTEAETAKDAGTDTPKAKAESDTDADIDAPAKETKE